MKVYISGKIGEEVISEATRQKFARAEEKLRTTGRFTEVFNPTNKSWQYVLKRGYEIQFFDPNGVPANAIPFCDYVLLRDLMALSLKDFVYFLDDWDKSPGAQSEFSFAMATGKKIFFASREHAVYHLEEEWRKAKEVVAMKTPRYKYVELHLHELWLPI